MSAIGSRPLERAAIAAWIAATSAGLALAWVYPRVEALPFHLSWIGFVVIALWRQFYGFRSRFAAVVLALSWVAVGAHDAMRDRDGIWELVEIPIMVGVYVVLLRLGRAQRRAVVAEHEQLERQRTFMRRVAHGLRTPIAIARGHVELARRQATGGQVLSDLVVAEEELDRLARTAARLLRVAAVDIDIVSVEPIDVEELVDDALRRWSSTAARAWSAQVTAVGIVHADGDALREALDALIENAVTFTDTGDPVSVLAFVRRDVLWLGVADGGRGMEVVEPQRLFEPFGTSHGRHGVDGRPSNVGAAGGRHGTGLGLAIVRAVARAHGGDVQFTSEPGVGTLVSFSIRGFAACTLDGEPSTAPAR